MRSASLSIVAASTLALLMGSCGGDYAGEGRRAYQAGSYARAADLLEIALRQDEKNHELRYLLASSLKHSNEPGPAARQFKVLMGIPELRSRATGQYVQTLLEAGEVEDAAATIRKALEEAPEDPVLVEALADVHWKSYETHLEEIERYLASSSAKDYQTTQAMETIERLTTARADQLKDLTAEVRPWFETNGITDLREIRERGSSGPGRIASRPSRCTSGCWSRSPEALIARFRLGKVALDRRDFDRAQELLVGVASADRASIVDPERRIGLQRLRREAARMLVRVYATPGTSRDNQNCERAISVAARLLELLPGEDALYEHLCSMYFFNDERENSTSSAGAGSRATPPARPANFYLGYCLLVAGDHDAALGYLETAAGGNEYWLFDKYLGMALVRGQRRFRGLTHLARALEHQQRDAELLIFYAQALGDAGEQERAKTILVDALKGHFRHSWRRGTSPRRLGRSELIEALTAIYKRQGLAIDDLQDARRLHAEDPDNPLVALELARQELAAGDPARARQLCREVQNDNPEYPDGWLVGARIDMELADWRAALVKLGRLEKVQPGSADAAWMEARARMELGDLDNARAAAERALAASEGDLPGAELILLELDLAEGRHADVERRGERLLTSFPSDASVLQAVARSRVAQDKWDAALAPLEQLAGVQSGSAETHVELGECLLHLGRLEDAAREFRQASDLAHDAPALRTRAARGLARAGDPARAIEVLEEVVAALDDEESKAEIQAELMELHHDRGNFSRVCDLAADLRRSRHDQLAFSRFLRLAADARAWHEAAASLKVLQSESRLDEETRLQGLRILLVLGDWNGVLQMAEDLLQRRTSRVLEVQRARVRAFLGLRDREQAHRILDESLAAAGPSERSSLLSIWARFLLESGEPGEALAAAEDGLSRDPRNLALLRLATQAALAKGDDSRAEGFLDYDTGERAREALAALRVRDLRYAAAEEGVAPDPRKPLRRIHDLLRAIRGEKGDHSGLAAFLLHLKQRNFDAAEAASSAVDDLPASFQPILERLARGLRASPQDAGLLAETLARTAIFAQAGILESVANAELETAAERFPRQRSILELYRAWIRLGYDSGEAVAAILLGALKSDEPEPLAVYLAARSAVLNTGPKNVPVLLDGFYGKGSIPVSLGRDLAIYLTHAGEFELAAACLDRIAEPSPVDFLARAALSVCLGRFVQASQLLEHASKLTPLGWPFGLAHAYGRAFEAPADDTETREALRRQLADIPEKLDREQNLLVLRAALLLREEELALATVERLLRGAPYDAFVMKQVWELLEHEAALPALRERLKVALDTVDPLGDLRDVPARKRKLAPW